MFNLCGDAMLWLYSATSSDCDDVSPFSWCVTWFRSSSSSSSVITRAKNLFTSSAVFMFVCLLVTLNLLFCHSDVLRLLF